MGIEYPLFNLASTYFQANEIRTIEFNGYKESRSVVLDAWWFALEWILILMAHDGKEWRGLKSESKRFSFLIIHSAHQI